MASWSGDVEICNGALSILGAARITSLDDTSKEAILCKLFYETCRDSTLRLYPWNFAIKRKNLGAALATTDSNAPVWGYAYAYTLPTDPYCLRVLEVQEDVAFKVEGRVLYCDATSINIRYIRRVTSVQEMDDNFKMTLSAVLAIFLAMPITKSKAMTDNAKGLFDIFLGMAQAADTQEGTADDIDSDELINIRGGAFVSRSQFLAR